MRTDLTPKDCFEVRILSHLDDRDVKVLVELYGPIIGASAIGLYFNLISLKDEIMVSHEKLLHNTQLSIGELISGLSCLEAMGLVKTYNKSDVDLNYYIYCMFSPVAPDTFLSDPLLAGTLNKYIGIDELMKLGKKYKLDKLPDDNFDNISESFADYFHPNFSEEIYEKSVLETGGKRSGTIDTYFDRNDFLLALKAYDPRFSSGMFDEETLLKIDHLSSLYSYSEETIAGFVFKSYDWDKSPNKRLNFADLKRYCRDNIKLNYLQAKPKAEPKFEEGNTELGRTIKKMQTIPPVEFLKTLQSGHKPANPDIRLIERLSLDMGMTNESINALIMYVLATNNNVLSNNLVEKIAGSVVREGCMTAIDTLNFLDGNQKSSNKDVSYKDTTVDKKPYHEEEVKKEIKTQKPETDEFTDEILEDSQQLEDFLDSIGDFGGNN